MLTGCGSSGSELDEAMLLRKELLQQGCRFRATITADYGTDIYVFTLDCSADSAGTVSFSVTQPAAIAGITGRISDDGAALTFDDTVLAFPVLADGRLSPVCVPWVFLNTLRAGYLTGCGRAGEGLLICANDTYEENALYLEIETTCDRIPIRADIYWNQQRIICLEIADFVIE